MSKLLDRLNQTSKGNKPIGFRAAAAKPDNQRLLLIAALSSGDSAAMATAKEHADAVIYGETAKIEKAAAAIGDTPWGVSLGEADGAQLGKLKDKGCDFIVFDAEKAPLAVLRDEGMGRVVELSPELPDGLIRTVTQLPIDMALIGGDAAISVRRLMVCQHISNLTSKPLMARVPGDVSGEDLRELWEAGLFAVVLPISGDAKKQLSTLKQAIDKLPASRRMRGGKTEVSLPYARVEEPSAEEEIEEGE